MATVKCQLCGNEFEAGRNDAKWCSECKPIKRRENYTKSDKRHKYNSCPLCGKNKYYKSTTCVSCRKQKSLFPRGEQNPCWKGGRRKHTNGYVEILMPPSSGRSIYILEHRYIWEKAFGPIPKGIILHHLNGDKTDNRLENLCALRRNEHSPKLILEPFRKRINELESQVKRIT